MLGNEGSTHFEVKDSCTKSELMPKLIVIVVNTMELVHTYVVMRRHKRDYWDMLRSNNANNNGEIERKPQFQELHK